VAYKSSFLDTRKLYHKYIFSSIWHNKSNLHLTVENSRTIAGPLTGDGTINQLLYSIGVWKEHGKDESGSLGILRHIYRSHRRSL